MIFQIEGGEQQDDGSWRPQVAADHWLLGLTYGRECEVSLERGRRRLRVGLAEKGVVSEWSHDPSCPSGQDKCWRTNGRLSGLSRLPVVLKRLRRRSAAMTPLRASD